MVGVVGDLRKIDRFAARQHGVFSGAQARTAGYDKHGVARKLASGEWIQLDYRVFALASAPSTWERQLWVALLSRPEAVIGGRAAAHLHGFRGFSRVKPVIMVPGSSNARSQVAKVVRAEHFSELDLVHIRGFPVTSVAETLMTLSGEVPAGRFESLLDDLLLASRIDQMPLTRILEREKGRRRRGIVLLRNLVDERREDAPSQGASYLERMLERLLSKADLPPWSREHPFSIRGAPSRVDVYIAAWRLVIEADGRNWHARTEAYEHDRHRDNNLAVQGVQVIRLTYRMIKEDPRGCVDTIRGVGRVRSA
jgi:very-short-patch-repair endonuclease